MKRRTFLTGTATAGAAVLAGCSGDSGSEPSETSTSTTNTATTDTTTPETTTETTTQEPTTAAEPQPPEVTGTSLLTGWEDFGDVVSNQVAAVGQGANAVIGFRYEAAVSDGSADYTEQVRVYDPDGSRIALEDHTGDQLVEGDERREWEYAFSFDTSQWERGQYTYEVLVRDNSLDEVSEPMDGVFRVNEPLQASEAGIANVDAADTITAGDDYQFTLEFANEADRDGSVVSHLDAKFESNESWTEWTEEPLWCNVASGGTNTWESGTVSFDTPGTLQFRVNQLDEIWTLEVTDN